MGRRNTVNELEVAAAMLQAQKDKEKEKAKGSPINNEVVGLDTPKAHGSNGSERRLSGLQAELKRRYDLGGALGATVCLFPHYRFVIPAGAVSESINSETGEMRPIPEVIEKEIPGMENTVRIKTGNPLVNSGRYEMFWYNRDKENPLFIKRSLLEKAVNNENGSTFNGFHNELIQLMKQFGFQVWASDFVPKPGADGKITKTVTDIERAYVQYLKNNHPANGYMFTITKSRDGYYFVNPLKMGEPIPEETGETVVELKSDDTAW